MYIQDSKLFSLPPKYLERKFLHQVPPKDKVLYKLLRILATASNKFCNKT